VSSGQFIARIRPQANDGTTDIRTSPLAHGKRIFMYFLQELFRDPNPTGFRYMDDDKETGIIIKGAFAKDQETYNTKPIIAVDRGGAQIQSRTLGSIEFVDYKTGGYTRTELIPFSLIARVLSENEYTAEQIAYFVASTTFLLRHVLIRQGFYHVGNQMVINPPMQPVGVVPADQAGLVMIQITMPCSHLMTGRFVPINRPYLKDTHTIIKDSQSGATLLPEDEGSQD